MTFIPGKGKGLVKPGQNPILWGFCLVGFLFACLFVLGFFIGLVCFKFTSSSSVK